MMNIIANPIFLEHDTGQHPENRQRLECLNIEEYTEIKVDGEEYLPLVHERAHIQQIRDAAAQGATWIDQDTFVGARSFDVAVAAVGATIMSSTANGFALVRPPGHHAYHDHSSGFCLFNNLAVAVENLRREGKRVFILDFDGHLGDGTSQYFYHSDAVMFWSLHQFPAFPGKGRSNEIGSGKGKGFTINVPLPPGSGDDIFMHAFKNYFPVIEQFEPDVIAISAGFDAHRHDPLLQLNLSSNTFYEIGSMLAGKYSNIFAVLEGGYNTSVLPHCIGNFLAGINKSDLFFDEGHSVSFRTCWEQYDLDLHYGMSCLSPYWKF
ncbi:MAG: histone deacetylase [Saprospiraceae bacterium]|nr:histone deacetylase [Saprospiraceae bacterium]